MQSHCPDDILRRVHYFVRQWITCLDYETLFNILESFKGEYEELPPDSKHILETTIEEIIDSIDPLFEKAMIEAGRYNYLSPEIKALFETNINSLLNVNHLLNESLQNTELVKKLESIIIQDPKKQMTCSNCELVKKIYSNKRLTERNSST